MYKSFTNVVLLYKYVYFTIFSQEIAYILSEKYPNIIFKNS